MQISGYEVRAVEACEVQSFCVSVNGTLSQGKYHVVSCIVCCPVMTIRIQKGHISFCAPGAVRPWPLEYCLLLPAPRSRRQPS